MYLYTCVCRYLSNCPVPVCPHAGGVGLCELVQHLSMWDYICVSRSKQHRLVRKIIYWLVIELHLFKINYLVLKKISSTQNFFWEIIVHWFVPNDLNVICLISSLFHANWWLHDTVIDVYTFILWFHVIHLVIIELTICFYVLLTGW
jgi:hypothetical protein